MNSRKVPARPVICVTIKLQRNDKDYSNFNGMREIMKGKEDDDHAEGIQAIIQYRSNGGIISRLWSSSNDQLQEGGQFIIAGPDQPNDQEAR